MNVLRDKVTATRKAHLCDACDRKFPAGTMMRAATCADNGEIWVWRECPACNELLKRFPKDFDDGFGRFEGCCVADVLYSGETPEMVLDAKLKQFTYS
jgi:hypothetical protein